MRLAARAVGVRMNKDGCVSVQYEWSIVRRTCAMQRVVGSVIVVLIACFVASEARSAGSDDAVKENPWQLLDSPDRIVLAKIGIKDDTTLEIGVGLMRNALTRHQDAAVRAACAKVLGRLEAKAASDALMWALNDRDVTVRREAAKALGVLQERRAVDPLATLLRKEPDAENRLIILQAFGVIGDRQAGPILGETLIKDTDERVRCKAAEVINQMEDKRAWRQLIQALSDASPGVRMRAAQALGTFKDKRAVDELIARLKDEHPDVRGAAAGALGWIDSSKAINPLIELLQDPHAGVRATVADALGRLRSKRAVKHLEKLAEGDPDEHVRQVATDAIKAIEGGRD